VCGSKTSKGCSEDTIHDSDKGIADFARDQVASINCSSHAERAFGSRAQDHLEGLAEAGKGSKEVVLGVLGQHIIQPCCYRSWD
jgi:hypothetical protein